MRGCARRAHDHPVGLPRHSHARLGFDIEERFDARRVREFDGPLGYQVSFAFERHLSAIHFGAAEEERPIE